MSNFERSKSKGGVTFKFQYDLDSAMTRKAKHYQETSMKNYEDSRRKYNKYFLKCVDEIEELQPSGFACIQISRYFTVGVLPKYCSIPDPLTRKQRDRVERLLAD